MSTAILYFLPTTSTETSPLTELINRLTTHYDPSILPHWSLRQRLFRSTRAPLSNDGDTTPTPARHLQIHSFPNTPNDSLVVITPSSSSTDTTTEPVTNIIALPTGQPTEDFTQLLITRLGSLWQQRQLLDVVDGLAYEVGDFRVRAGELKQGVGGSQLVRGVVIEVAYLGQEEGLERAQTEEIITAFWDELGIKGARDFRGWKRGKEDNGFDNVRLWSRALMLKG